MGGTGAPSMSDHDLLVAMYVKLDTLVTVHKDHERRLRRVEWALLLAGGAGLASGGALGVLLG